jgi:WD40 repeat protein
VTTPSPCDPIGALLSGYLAGELDELAANEVVNHLAGCPSCGRLGEKFTWQDIALNELAGQTLVKEMTCRLSAALINQIPEPLPLAAVKEFAEPFEKVRQTIRPRRRWRWLATGIAAGILAVVMGLGIRNFIQQKPLPPDKFTQQFPSQENTKPPPAPQPPRKDSTSLVARNPVPSPQLEPDPVYALPVAILEGMSGAVYVQDAKAKNQALARAGQPLYSGQGLATKGPGSSAEVKFADGTRLQLTSDTQIAGLIDGATERGSNQPGKEIILDKGQLRADVVKQPEGKPMVLTTPKSKAVVVGTRFTLAADPEFASLEVNQGLVRFIRQEDGQSVEVRKGHYAVIAKDVDFAPRPIKAGEPRSEIWRGHSESVLAVAYSPDGLTLATGSGDGSVKLWDVSKKIVRATLQGHGAQVESVTFSSDGKTLASAGWDRTVKLWDVATGKIKNTLQGHRSSVMAVAFAPDGRTLASGSFDRTVKLWDVLTAKERRTLEGHSEAVRSLTFSPDGMTLASGSADGKVGLWLAETGKHLRWCPGDGGWVYSLAFCRDSKTLISGCADGGFRFWEVQSGREILRRQAHQKRITALAIAPDGSVMASASTEGSIRFWDSTTGEEISQRQDLPQQEISSLAFSPDGKTMASGSWDATVMLLDVSDQVNKD